MGASLSLFSALFTFLRLRAFSDPPGLNGYFYLKQTKTLAESGSFYFGDHSLSFFPLVILRWISGSELLAFQLGISLTLFVLGQGVCALVERIPAKPMERLISQAAIIAALFSSSFFAEFSLNFFKNLSAAALLVWCAVFLLAGRRRTAFGLFFLAFLTHKSVALVGGLFLAAWGARQVRELLLRRNSRVLLRIAGAAAAAVVFGFLFLYHFPKAQAFLEYASGTFTAPGPRLRWWGRVLENVPQRGAEVVAWFLILLGCFAGRRFLPATARLIADTSALLFLLAVHPFQTVGPATLGYRQLLFLPALLYPLSAFILYLPRPWFRLAGLLPLCGIFFFSFAPFGFKERVVKKQIRPYSLIREGVEKIPQIVNPADHLSSHHGLEFFVDYVTGIRSRSFLAAPDYRGANYRIAFLGRRLPPGPTRDEIAQASLLNLGRGYFLLSEEDWQAILSDHDIPHSWKNQIGRRPAHVYE